MLHKVEEFSLLGKVIIVTGGIGVLGEALIYGIALVGGIVGILGRNEKLQMKEPI